MTGRDKTCYLFTQSFPFGDGEVFVEKEIPYLCGYFKEIVIFPLTKETAKSKTLPANASAHFLFDGQGREYSSVSTLKENLLMFTGLMMKELILHPRITIKQFKVLSSDLLQQFYRAQLFRRFLRDEEANKPVFYSYWFDRWALILSIAKKQSRVHFNFDSRAHGYEIFKEQTRFGYHPFKQFMLSGVKRVYTVSKQGMDYLKNNFPAYEKKIDYSYLGTSGGELTNLKDGSFHMISCAHVREVKRLDKVCEILACIPAGFKIVWTLIGDGKDLAKIKQKSENLPQNVTCHFTGNMTPEEIMKFYSDNSINLFLSVSRSEGLPYTMMEAISFGIPIMSTDVGGCREIVTEQTGILIEKDFDAKVVAEEIVKFSRSEMNRDIFRQGVRKFWEDHFSAEKNYFRFYKGLLN